MLASAQRGSANWKLWPHQTLLGGSMIRSLLSLGPSISAFVMLLMVETFDAQSAETRAYDEPYRPQYHFSPASGWIMGSTIDSSNVSHAFLRAPDGGITEFDAPGAGAGAGAGAGQAT